MAKKHGHDADHSSTPTPTQRAIVSGDAAPADLYAALDAVQEITITYVLPTYDFGPGSENLRIGKRRKLNAEERRKRGEDGWPWSAEALTRLVDAGVPVKVRTFPAVATCGATTRRGSPCRCLAMANGRCRLHGGASTGPKSSAGWQRTREGYRAWVEQCRAERARKPHKS